MITEAELKTLRERDDRWTGVRLMFLAFATLAAAATVILLISK